VFGLGDYVLVVYFTYVFVPFDHISQWLVLDSGVKVKISFSSFGGLLLRASYLIYYWLYGLLVLYLVIYLVVDNFSFGSSFLSLCRWLF